MSKLFLTGTTFVKGLHDNVAYETIEFDDWTHDEGLPQPNTWSQVCDECIQKYNQPDATLGGIGSGICGIKGCENEATEYIDFPEGTLFDSMSQEGLIAHIKQKEQTQ